MNNSQTDLQNSILSAIDNVVQNRIDQLELDKTVTASIYNCQRQGTEDNPTAEYMVSYQGGKFKAYAQDGAVYAPRTSVLVQIPQGDFSKRKIILGPAITTQVSKSTSTISHDADDFEPLGENLLTTDKEEVIVQGKTSLQDIGLISYSEPLGDTGFQAYKELYRHNGTKNLISFNEDILYEYLKQSAALLLQADFKTNLDATQQKSLTGHFGLNATLAFQQGGSNKTYREDLDEISSNYSRYFQTATVDNKIQKTKYTLYFCERKIEEVFGKLEELIKTPLIDNWEELVTAEIANFAVWSNRCKTIISVNELEDKLSICRYFANCLSSVENDFAEDEESTLMQRIQAADYDWNTWLTSINADNVKTITYTLDSSQDMKGNPLLYKSFLTQQKVCGFDAENFLYVDSISFYCGGFTVNAEKAHAMQKDLLQHCGDIFIANVQLVPLTELSAKSGDYRLKVKKPKGSLVLYEDSQYVPAEIELKASLTYKVSQDLTSQTTFLWFQKDGRVINSESEGYHTYAGIGWKNVTAEYGSKAEITIPASNLKAYHNTFMCIALYSDEAILIKNEFTLTNYRFSRTLKIDSSLGDTFTFDRGIPTFTCSSDKETLQGDTYPCYWSYITPNEGTVFLDFTIDGELVDADVKREYLNEKISDTSLSLQERLAYSRQLETIEEISFKANNSNQISFPAKKINGSSQVIFTCYAYKRDEDEEYLLGSAEFTAYNTNVTSISEYRVEIENGQQVFKYNAAGVAPTSARYKTNNTLQQIQSLLCHLYDPNGIEVNSNKYSVIWQFPLENTLLKPGEGVILTENPGTGEEDLLVADVCDFTIEENYSYNKTDNQLKCFISYGGNTYIGQTSFMFAKEGDNGTNGTDIMAYISPIDSAGQTNSPWQDEMLTLEIFKQGENFIPISWNGFLDYSDTNSIFQFSIFDKNQEAELNSVRWRVPGSSGNRYLQGFTPGTIISQAKADWEWSALVKDGSVTSAGRKVNNQMAYAEGTLTNIQAAEDGSVQGAGAASIYTCVYPFATIQYNFEEDDSNYNTYYRNGQQINRLSVNKTKTLSNVLYNKDGRLPIYDTHKGVFVDGLLNDDNSYKYFVYWRVKGGVENGSYKYENCPAIKLTTTEGDTSPENRHRFITSEDLPQGQSGVYVIPAEIYSGESLNNRVEIFVYATKNDYSLDEQVLSNNLKTEDDGLTPVQIFEEPTHYLAKISVPIYLSLNTYGLDSLNGWDGNAVTINEDEGYVLAPQIGAGEKDENNRFTGILMGKMDTFNTDESNERLKENAQNLYPASEGNEYDNAQLREQYIAENTFPRIGIEGYSNGKQSIFLNARTGSATFGLTEAQSISENRIQEGRIQLVPGGISSIANWKLDSRSLYSVKEGTMGSPYEDKIMFPSNAYAKAPKGALRSIPSDKEGILISSDPAYISIKGHPIGADTSIEIDAPETLDVHMGDSYEVQFDPNQSSLFTIYQHSNISPESEHISVETTMAEDGTPVYKAYYLDPEQAHPEKLLVAQCGPSSEYSYYQSFNMVPEGTLSQPHYVALVPQDVKTYIPPEGFENVNSYDFIKYTDFRVEDGANIATFNIPVKEQTPVANHVYYWKFNVQDSNEKVVCFEFSFSNLPSTDSMLYWKNLSENPPSLTVKWTTSTDDGELADPIVIFWCETNEGVFETNANNCAGGYYKPNSLTNSLYVVGDAQSVGELTEAIGPGFNTLQEVKDQAAKWYYRRVRVGIDDKGRFFSNALKEGNSAFNIGPLGSFGFPMNRKQYTGVSFESGSDVTNTDIWSQLFIDSVVKDDNNAHSVYLTTGGDGQEYQHNLKLYGKTVSLYAGNNSVDGGKDNTNDFIKVQDKNILLFTQDNNKSTSLSLNPELGQLSLVKDESQAMIEIVPHDTSTFFFSSNLANTVQGEFSTSVAQDSNVNLHDTEVKIEGDTNLEIAGKAEKTVDGNVKETYKGELRYSALKNNIFTLGNTDTETTQSFQIINPTLGYNYSKNFNSTGASASYLYNGSTIFDYSLNGQNNVAQFYGGEKSELVLGEAPNGSATTIKRGYIASDAHGKGLAFTIESPGIRQIGFSTNANGTAAYQDSTYYPSVQDKTETRLGLVGYTNDDSLGYIQLQAGTSAMTFLPYDGAVSDYRSNLSAHSRVNSIITSKGYAFGRFGSGNTFDPDSIFAEGLYLGGKLNDNDALYIKGGNIYLNSGNIGLASGSVNITKGNLTVAKVSQILIDNINENLDAYITSRINAAIDKINNALARASATASGLSVSASGNLNRTSLKTISSMHQVSKNTVTDAGGATINVLTPPGAGSPYGYTVDQTTDTDVVTNDRVSVSGSASGSVSLSIPSIGHL